MEREIVGKEKGFLSVSLPSCLFFFFFLKKKMTCRFIFPGLLGEWNKGPTQRRM